MMQFARYKNEEKDSGWRNILEYSESDGEKTLGWMLGDKL
jgi:hypothetical protein